MKTVPSLAKLDDEWKDCIGRLARLWFKTEASLKGDPKFYNSPWVKRVQTARKLDPLVQYIFQARHADEHGTADVTAKIPAGMQVNAPAKGGMLYIRNLEINGDAVRLDAPLGASVTFEPAEVAPLPVTNHGRTYNVPSHHDGKPLLNPSLLEIAQFGVTFYEQVISGLEADGWDS